MTIRAIVSYDDTPGDHDALILGKVLSAAGVDLVLAYVRHAFQAELTREQLEEHEAEGLLDRGARHRSRVNAITTPVRTKITISACITTHERGI